MQIRFLGQPVDTQPTLFDFIEHATTSGFDEIKIAVAWAKRSGLGRIWDALSDFRVGGGKVVLIIGVSEGGATVEGLDLALKASDEAYVFHDPRRTFHPKVYFASSTGLRSLLVGSSNLTAGGLGWNFEASIWIDLEPGEQTALTDEVDKWFDLLIGSTTACQPLDVTLISQLQASSDIFIGSEAKSRRARKGRGSDLPEDTDSAVSTSVSGLFSSVSIGLHKLPGLNAGIAPLPGAPGTRAPTAKLPTARTAGAPAATPTPGSDAELASDAVKRRWYKLLDNTAAQQVKSANSHPTGNLRLSMEEAPINHRVYFRDDFFGGLPWAPTEGKTTESEVVVQFHVWIDGHDLGDFGLRISHDPNRVSGQGNVPTVLHWGDLSPVMKATSYMGYYVNLERTDTGDFNLIISKDPRPGGYLP